MIWQLTLIFHLAKYNASIFEELFMHYIGAKEEKDKILIEMKKLNENQCTQNKNF